MLTQATSSFSRLLRCRHAVVDYLNNGKFDYFDMDELKFPDFSRYASPFDEYRKLYFTTRWGVQERTATDDASQAGPATFTTARKKLITQAGGCHELGLSARQVKRLLYALKKGGDMTCA